MKNKKGTLLTEETLKIFISVIVLGILIYFLASLYFANTNEEKQKQAEEILGKISEFTESSETNLLIAAVTPIGWSFFSFTEQKKPNQCAGENCLCICDSVIDVFDRQLNECSKVGRCAVIDSLQNFDEIEIESGTNIEVKRSDGKIIIEVRK